MGDEKNNLAAAFSSLPIHGLAPETMTDQCSSDNSGSAGRAEGAAFILSGRHCILFINDYYSPGGQTLSPVAPASVEPPQAGAETPLGESKQNTIKLPSAALNRR